jgi:hypothetical protein
MDGLGVSGRTVARPLCVHLGLPKTATTTLQKGLFALHSEVAFLGKRAGKQAHPEWNRCSTEAAFRLADMLFWERALALDVDEASRLYAEEILPAIGPDKTPIYSYEGLAAADLDRRQAIAHNLKRVFDGCKVVVGIRQPVEWVQALYFQRLRRNHLHKQARRFRPPRSPSPQQWLESIVSGVELVPHFDYARTIRIFADALGRTNVGVFAIEQLARDPIAFATDLSGFLEIDPEEGVRHIEGRRDNRRLMQPVADRMRAIEASRFGSVAYSIAGHKMRKRIVGMGSDQSGERARFSVAPEFEEAIHAMTREGNRWIASEWRLPLEEYGYPL